MIEYDQPENIREGDHCLAAVPCTHSRWGRQYMIRRCSFVERFGSIIRLTCRTRDKAFEVPLEAISSVWRYVPTPATTNQSTDERRP